MLLGETLFIALQSIRANLFRASLTMLGIIIGVAAVITMVALGTGARAAIDEQMQALGGNILSIGSSHRFSRGVARNQDTLTTDDAHALARDSEYLDGVVPEIDRRQQVKYGNLNLNLTILGTTPNYREVYSFEIATGSMFRKADDSARRRVAVLGSEIPGMLKSDAASIIGRTIQIRSISFDVIGVLQSKGSSGWRNPDDDIWIPLSTAQFRVTGDNLVKNIGAKIRDGAAVPLAMVEIERILRREHGILPGADNDFSIMNRKQFLDSRQEATEVFTYLLASIAGVSLLVGGIGIMNIMLVTVTERTREIGIRKALGATRLNILMQFLVEAMILCLIGGAVGILLGTGIATAMTKVVGWQTIISPIAIGIAFLFSAGIGLLFGILPARKAARLDPIEALRYE
jgi:putative ABC transport system permease protein